MLPRGVYLGVNNVRRTWRGNSIAQIVAICNDNGMVTVWVKRAAMKVLGTCKTCAIGEALGTLVHLISSTCRDRKEACSFCALACLQIMETAAMAPSLLLKALSLKHVFMYNSHLCLHYHFLYVINVLYKTRSSSL